MVFFWPGPITTWIDIAIRHLIVDNCQRALNEVTCLRAYIRLGSVFFSFLSKP
jgi:hypothetical protein